MADIDSILVSLSPSLPYIQKLITGAGYIMGLYFIFSAIFSLAEMSDKQKKQAVRGGWTHPMAYMFAGAALLWLPTTVDTLNASFFGSNSPLSYSKNGYDALQTDLISIVKQIITVGGVFWIVHGFALFVHSAAADPNDEQRSGKKAWLFILGGLLAMNNELTTSMIQTTIQTFVQAKHSLYPIQQSIQSYF
jgi:hypothetical protein